MAIRKRRSKRRPRRAERIRKAAARLDKAIKSADRRGYTGMVSGKGGLHDDPIFLRAMKEYDKAIGPFRA